MTDNRTTEKLCKLLEEHGIARKKRRGYIRWSKQTKYGVTHYQAWPCFDGTITLTVRDEYGLTPEQAIAVTLGDEWNGKPFVEYAEHVAKEIHNEAFALLEGCDEPDFSAIDAICTACENVRRITR